MAAFRSSAQPLRESPATEGTFLGRRFRIGTFFGFEVAVDASWIFLALLVTWSLATGLFPAQSPGLNPQTYWAMGAAGALGLFVSIVLHELSHSIVARRTGLEMRGITLFLFGGVAHLGGEPKNPRSEFLVAIVGPITSAAIGLLAFATGAAAAAGGLGVPLAGILRYLAYINLLLAAFNLVPAFPLDGGRVLRAALWHRTGNFRRATRIASGAGSVFGTVLMVLGVVSAAMGLFVAGMWWFLIGMFLRGAARMSYEQAVLQDSLAGEPVRRFMRTDLRTVPAEATLGALIEDYFYRDYHKMYPVVDHGRLAGCVSIEQVKRVPREEWASRTVSEVATACSPENTIPADTDAVEALATMRRTGNTRLIVTEGKGLAGILTLKDLLGFLAVKMALEPG